MTKDSVLKFTKGDAIATGLVALTAVAILLILFLSPAGSPAATATVFQNGVPLCTLDLSQDTEYTVTGTYTNVITVRNGEIAVTDTNCPGKDCRDCGWQHLAGRNIICLPNRMEIRLDGQSDTDAETR